MLAKKLGLPIILDESFVRAGQFSLIQNTPSLWVVNIRSSKVSRLVPVPAGVAQARALGIPTVVGAQVGETSILTRAALAVGDRYRDILIAQERAFGTNELEYDAATRP